MADEHPQNPGSLLDRVLQSQQSEVLEHFNALDVVTELLKQLTPKEADVLRRRFGFQSGEPETLETIGQTLNVTRERVRQIQRWAIDRLVKAAHTRHILRGFDAMLQQALEERGGVMLEDELLANLHSHAADTPQLRAATLFILEYLLRDKFQRHEEMSFKPHWKLLFANTDLLDGTIAAVKEVLRAAGQPLSREEVLQRLEQTDWWKQHSHQLNAGIALSYISISQGIERNPFHEYGLREWGSVVPKRMHDKILLVMRKHGQPMHFHEITQKINEIGFDHRQAYPPTVHNELILNKEYVLVGRGIYALREWGYQPGVVADVLVAILKTTGQPMTREALVDAVLKQRMVKKNTVHLALTNKKLFQRQADGRYALADLAQSKPTDHDSDHAPHPQ